MLKRRKGAVRFRVWSTLKQNEFRAPFFGAASIRQGFVSGFFASKLQFPVPVGSTPYGVNWVPGVGLG